MNSQFPVEAVQFPLMPLRDIVIFPRMVAPLFVGRPKSIAAVEIAMERGGMILLATQKTSGDESPDVSAIFEMGCIAQILQLLRLPDGTIKVLVQGTHRARLRRVEEFDTHFGADFALVEGEADAHKTTELEALRRALLQQAKQYAELNKSVQPDIVTSLDGIDDHGRLVDTVAMHLPFKTDQKQMLLELVDLVPRYEFLLARLAAEIDFARVDRRIQDRIKRQVEKSQREYYLSEQVKAINRELGKNEETDELDKLEEQISAAGMPAEARDKALAELKKLRMMPPMSNEATVVRNYLDILLGLPWKKKSRVNKDLPKAEKVLEDEHYGLQKVKERIIEYLAVQQRVEKVKSPILCLVGPPGVGKTSLGESIARATNRKFVRMALGGVHDEAEIRGHRRTYIGSMPGRILQGLAKAGVRNPLILLDEIDKLGADFRGDPAAALLEVLDPEQNARFADHYVEVDFDLSDVMFVATSNSYRIPPALLDRMEVIRLSGYTEDEKLSIVRRHLLPRQIRHNGLKDGEIGMSESAVRDIIRYYTREAGVRSLDRELAKICRKVVKMLLLKKASKRIMVTSRNLDKFLGVRRFDFGVAEKENQVGQVSGLAWTEVGGDLLTVEAAVVPGKGAVVTTGTLGDVMKESIQAARTVVRRHAARLGIRIDRFGTSDIHIHVPEGATPKDGPSAGIAMTTALVSVFTDIPVRADVAMTGEITLRGEVLAIGGLKEKLLAAHRGGIKTVLIPEQNVKDLAEIPDNVKNSLEIVPVRWIDKVLEVALATPPVPLTEDVAAAAAAAAVAAAAKDNGEQTSVRH